MHIMVGESRKQVPPGTTLFQLRSEIKPDADIMVLNGFPFDTDVLLQEGDRVVLICRGQMPSEAELEACLVARHTPGVHDVVRRACVGIAGVGGLGSNVAVALVRLGIGRLVLADYDVVEPSNLNRQQFFIDQIGLFKVNALKATLQRINPYVAIETHCVRLDPTNVPEVFTSVNVLVEAFDNPKSKVMLVETFSKTFPGIPVVMASGVAGDDSANIIRTRRLTRTVYIVGDESLAACPGRGLMAPRVGVAAHHQANAVLRILLGKNVE